MEPVCDLVLLSWNHLEETQPCLESLFEEITVPSRLLIVDNGSEPSVRVFLKSVTPRGAIQEVVFLQNETNEGFPRGMNRGLRASRAPYVCLLNNDLRFGKGWLQEMIDVAGANPSIGVLNPTSSTFGVYPPHGMSYREYNQTLAPLRGQYVEVGMCIGFCMLITRAVIDRIGGLNEEVERIFFEDEEYCMRAQQAGFLCVVASASYVYHTEHSTVKQMPEREALFGRNRDWLRRKWGRRLRIAYPRFTPVQPGSSELRRWLEELVAMARKRRFVYVYCPSARRISKQDLFRSVGLVPHADVGWYPLSSSWPAMTAMGRILSRRKKPFDVIVAPDDQWAQWMARMQWWHRADVIAERDRERLEQICQQKSRFPS